MTKKKKFFIAVGIFLAISFVSGISILAATTYGTATDPLVTLSYLTNKLTPEIMNDLNGDLSSAQANLTTAFNTKINDFTASIETKLDGSSSGTSGSTFSVVTLTNGQTVVCAPGAEIMLRIGTAQGCGGSSPALVDTTGGATLAAGSSLTTNHMYMVTIAGNGIRATAGTVKVLIRGTYTVS